MGIICVDTIGITVPTMIGIPALTTGRTIGSIGIGGTGGITGGELIMTGMAARITTIIDVDAQRIG